MTKHMADHASPRAEGSRFKHFLELARREGINPNARALSQRNRATGAARKVEEFLRIDRLEKA